MRALTHLNTLGFPRRKEEGERRKVKGGREGGGRVRQREWREDERKDKRYIECCHVCLPHNH